MDHNYTYSTSGDLDGVWMSVLVTIFLVCIALYALTAWFQMKLLMRAGHAHPGSAWVPVWSTVTLWETGGIRNPWIWCLLTMFGSSVLAWIPIIGWLAVIFLWIVSIMLTVYSAKGIQAGLGLSSTGGLVLAVLFPLVWLIWMALRSSKHFFNQDEAIRAGGTFPFAWFGPGQPYGPFGRYDADLRMFSD